MSISIGSQRHRHILGFGASDLGFNPCLDCAQVFKMLHVVTVLSELPPHGFSHSGHSSQSNTPIILRPR